MGMIGRQRAAALLGVVLVGAALGGGHEARAQTDLYRVEVIVFTQTGGQSGTPEQWPRRPGAARFDRYAELRGDAETPDAGIYRRLHGDSLQLGAAARRLDASDTYRVLDHLAWIQPAPARAAAAAVALPPGSRPPGAESNPDVENGGDADAAGVDPAESPGLATPVPAGLSGGLRVWRERYLHAEVNLRWLPPEGNRREELRGATSLLVAPPPPVVVMEQRRRMRSDELHYLDHPVLGVLIRVSPVEEEDDS